MGGENMPYKQETVDEVIRKYNYYICKIRHGGVYYESKLEKASINGGIITLYSGEEFDPTSQILLRITDKEVKVKSTTTNWDILEFNLNKDDNVEIFIKANRNS